jgi:aminoglycoside 3-N-acetyltransferase
MTSRTEPRIVPPQLGLDAACRSLLDALPGWFGLPESNDEYVAFVAANPTWSAVDEIGNVLGILAPKVHAASCEIHLLAVAPEWHRRGVGRRLVEAFEADAMVNGFRLAQVKTLGPSHPDQGYAATRRFYAALGYLELEELTELWPDNPTAIMVKSLPEPGGERAVIAHNDRPVTSAMILQALQSAGVVEGSVVIVHSSVSQLGWVVGGAQAIVEALLASVGSTGTIVMPAQTGLSDPADWENPPVPEDWWPVIREAAPAFDPAATPMRGMGQVVECFRGLPGVLHSGHPVVGFVALGPDAETIVAHHRLEASFGDESPLGRLYDLDARVVMLGVGHANNTSLHLAEHRAEFSGKHTHRRGVPMTSDGIRQWVVYDDLDHSDDDFVAIGAAFALDGRSEQRVVVGAGEVVSCRVRELVDFAADWMERHRE